MNKKIFFTIISVIFFIFIIQLNVFAEDITSKVTLTIDDKTADSKLIDKNENSYIGITKNSTITIKSEDNIESIYIVYELTSKTGKLIANEKEIPIGSNGFLHEYINISEQIGETTEISLSYEENVKIGEITVLSRGEIPENVEIWDKPCEKADIMLFTTHSDDEQLFFLGLLPTYVAKGANVQVVYFANHNNTPLRLHEQLHGLYVVGIRNYPIMGIIPDEFSSTLKEATNNMVKKGISVDDAVKFQVEAIRRFKPQVVVGHDEKGEYQHGQHILCTYLLKQAYINAADETYDVETINKYGIWKIKKLYLHLYEKNPIIMDYDTPLDYFDGKTAYEVSKIGYSKHVSQQWTRFTKWINGPSNSYKKATEITTYSPLKYGLYFTTVGEDIYKNDMLENIVYYKDQEENNIDKNKEDNFEENIQEFVTFDEISEFIGKDFGKKFNFKIIIISILIFVFVVLVIFLIVKFFKKKNKKRIKVIEYSYNIRNIKNKKIKKNKRKPSTIPYHSKHKKS